MSYHVMSLQWFSCSGLWSRDVLANIWLISPFPSSRIWFLTVLQPCIRTYLLFEHSMKDFVFHSAVPPSSNSLSNRNLMTMQLRSPDCLLIHCNLHFSWHSFVACLAPDCMPLLTPTALLAAGQSHAAERCNLRGRRWPGDFSLWASWLGSQGMWLEISFFLLDLCRPGYLTKQRGGALSLWSSLLLRNSLQDTAAGRGRICIGRGTHYPYFFHYAHCITPF